MEKKIEMTHNFQTICLPNTWAFTLVIVLIANSTYAQNLELAGIKYNNYLSTEIKNDNGNQEVSFQEIGAFINIPKTLKNNKTILVNGFGYGIVEVALDNSLNTSNQITKKELQTVFYQFSLLHQWNEKWNLAFNLRPTLASDFETKLSSDDFVLQGALMATRKFNSKFKLGGGIAYSARFGSPQLLPVVNLRYKNNKHAINALLPVSASYTYSLLPNNKLDLGLKYNVNGANFNVYFEDNSIDKINYSRANFGVDVQYQLTNMFRLQAFGGLSTNRKFNLIDVDNTTYDYGSESAPFFSVGISLVPPKRKE